MKLRKYFFTAIILLGVFEALCFLLVVYPPSAHQQGRSTWAMMERIRFKAHEAENRFWLFGDSTAPQFYDPESLSLVSAYVSNGRVTCMGHYFLTKMLLQKGIRSKGIVILMRSHAWSRADYATADTGFFDESLIVPFGSLSRVYDVWKYSDRLDIAMRMLSKGLWPHEKIKFRYLDFFIRTGFVKSAYKPDVFLKYQNQDRDENYIDSAQLNYMRQMAVLAEKTRVKLIVGQTYYSDKWYEKNEKVPHQIQAELNRFADEFPNTVRVIDFSDNRYPDRMFKKDMIHFKDEDALIAQRNQVIEALKMLLNR